MKRGFGLRGLDVNSGWNWLPMKKGWFGSSPICMILLSAVMPEKTRPHSSRALTYLGLISYRCLNRSVTSPVP